MDKRIRKPVTSFRVDGVRGEVNLILCDDGTLWRFNEHLKGVDSHDWTRLDPPLPGSDAAISEAFTKA